MKKYILNEDSSIINKNGGIVITKGTEVVNNDDYIEADGGIKTIVVNGEYKGKEIMFSIKELTEA